VVALRQEERMNKKGRKKKEGIRAIGDGWYQIRIVRIDPRTGRRTERKRKLKAASIVEAERVRLQMIEALDREGSDEAPGTMPRLRLGDGAAQWLDRKQSAKRLDGTHRLTENTRARYEDTVTKMIVPFIGDYSSRL
jgi:hypothetical protein